MSMKKTDLEKQLAKKLDGRLKSRAVPQRFGRASAAAATPEAAAPHKPAAPKLVAVACRLPADLVARLRERAVGDAGGMNAVMARAVEFWLQAGATQAPATKP
jgi:hypothetical protein